MQTVQRGKSMNIKSIPKKTAKVVTKGLILGGKWSFKTAFFLGKNILKGAKEGYAEVTKKP
jgi:hypothetical protein|tara:strand:- start:109 stop:291 length:183 start_codon:yes stop_codon:yes gene_type:complete